MLLVEVAQAVPSEQWVLVGGLMVHAHAIRAGMDPVRHTSDLDVLIDITAARISEVAGPLQAAGFEALEPTGSGPFHRFKREHDIVDVMVPSTASDAFRWRGRGVLRSPGARQALERRDHYTVTGRSGGASVVVDVPDSTGAIVAKAAAYTVDTRDRERHLEDLVVLLAAASRRDLGPILSRRDRQHLRPALERLTDVNDPWWAQLDTREVSFARASFDHLTQLVNAHG